MDSPSLFEIPFVVAHRWIVAQIVFCVRHLPYSDFGSSILLWCITSDKYPDWPEPENK